MKPQGHDEGVEAPRAQEAAPEHSVAADDAAVPVVGIGASAGGLEALRQLFAAMPSNCGIAFVVVQHLDPSHESRTAEILAKHTFMPASEAEEGMSVRPDHIYTNPANRFVALRGGRLRLSEQASQDGIRRPIDFLLASLAEDRKERAIGIILSGSSGSDGLRGVRAIRAAGGMCMAQEPQTAHFPEMPQSVISAGLADYILPVGLMPQVLLAFVENVHNCLPADDGHLTGAAADDLESILDLLRVHAHSDYRHYRKTTLLRRIRRRAGLKQIGGMAAYSKLLQDDPNELKALARDMLIGVSSFFRDADAFEELRHEVIALVTGRDPDAPLRAWVPGCATGEEAYSIAMLLLEARASAGKSCPVQVFASDVDEQALETARAGTYPASIAEDVSHERLLRFFTRHGDRWQVDKLLRETVIFSRHNLLTDPPFSRLDLVSCRNVLIYLEPSAQRKVLTLFSFALKPGGYLFVGKAEGWAAVGEDLFEVISRQHRIARLVRANRRAASDFPTGRPTGFVPRGRPDPRAQALANANQEALLRHYDASIVLIDASARILYFHGRTERYLGHPKGPASLNLLDLAEGLLSVKLRRAIEKALRLDEAIAIPHVPMPSQDAPVANLTIMPIPSPVLDGKVLAVIFEDAPAVGSAETHPASSEDEPLVAQLEAEVKALRNQLRADAAEYGSSTLELTTANEEITSMNEELQSANEELEASKEELQSLNEELTNVNTQLNENIAALTATNSDLANLMTATQIGTIFLDRQLRIKRFTPRATKALNLIPSDVGRPIGDITQNFTGANLAVLAEKVLNDLSPVETEVQAQDHWFTVRVLPYRTLDDRIDGVVATFSDVSRLKDAEERLQYEKAYAQGIVETVRDPLLVLDGSLRVLSANKALYEVFRVEPEQTVGQLIYELGGRQLDIPRLRVLLEDVIRAQTAFDDFEVDTELPQIGRRTMLLTGRRLTGMGQERILLAMVDVTDTKAHEAIRALNESLKEQSYQLRDLASDLTRTEQRERERLAHVLHDDLQQTLVGAQFHLSRLQRRSDQSASRNAFEQVGSLLQQALQTSRSLTEELSPTILFEAGLDAALLWLARQMKIKHGLDVQTKMNASVPHDDEGMALLLFHAARELLFNVVKHSGVNQAVVELDRIDADKVRIVVSDSGSGFDSSWLEAAGSSNTGMGLFSMRERIHHAGGSVTVDSVAGRGTRVTLVVPVQQPPQEPAQAAHTTAVLDAPPLPERAGPPQRPIRVLLVDDHAIVRQGIAGILRQEPGIEIVGVAADGAQAVEQARRRQPDVIIMDVSMPGMNGIEATRVIHGAQPDVRIIGLSMYEEADRAEAMRRAGAVAYLSKGCLPEELLPAIRACLQENPQRPSDA